VNKSVIFHKILGFIFITFGLIFYLTPIPGTTILIVAGFVFLIGKKKTLNFFKRILSHKMFNKLRVKSIIKKI